MCRRLTYLFCVACLMVLLAVSDVAAQNYSGHNWYFGNTTRGIRFSRGTHLPVLINDKSPLGVGGSAVASDQINGTLLFYSDGVGVYDAGNALMPNGSLSPAGASVQNQPVAIAKRPGVENHFHLFYREPTGNVRAVLVDMTQFGNAVFPAPASGAVTTNTPVAGLTARSEAMITIPHRNGEDAWLITHESGTTNYMVTLIQAGGFTNGLPTPRGLITSAASFSYHEATGKIAVAPREADRDVEILDFDNDTGTLTFDQRVLLSGVTTMTTGEGIFDTEWSNSGHYLYISRNGDTGIQADVIQFDTRTPSITLVSALPQPNTIFRSYGLQLAPDSVMYHLYQAVSGGPFLLGGFTNTDTVAAVVQYAPQSFPGSLNFNGEQFPNFAPADTVGFTLDFTFTGTCQNTPTTFFPTVVSPAADSLVWDFGDGTSASGWSPVHTFQDAQPFNVTMTAFLNGQASLPHPETVTITTFDLQVTLPTDTTACSCQLPLPKNNPPPPCQDNTPFSVTAQITGTPASMQWFGPDGLIPGMTTATLTPQEAGYYYIVVQDASGCSTYAGVQINEYGVISGLANVWHFGQNAGIDFNPPNDNPPGPVTAITGPLNTPEGCAVVCDNNGQVIFSTDGRRIFDRAGTDITPAPVPPGLGGDPGATQSALIVPVPDDNTLYYIFTTQEVHGTNQYELRYSLFDLKLNGGTGAISQHNILLFKRSTERITSDGRWVIAHEYGNNSFRAYEVTAAGVGNPVITGIGSDHEFSVEQHGQGYLELMGNRLAVALSTPGVSNVVEIFDFDAATGILSDFRSANLGINNGQVYGLEFDGNKLYASITTPGNSPIVELFFDNNDIPHLVKEGGPPPAPSKTVPGEAGAIQRGPDGQIYIAVRNSQFLATIQPSADTTILGNITPNGFQLAASTQSLLGLPNVINDPLGGQGPGISVAGQCEDDSVFFSGTPTADIDKFFWEIINTAGGAPIHTDTLQSFGIIIADPGNYEARLRLTNRCDLDTTFTLAFQIFAKPVPPNFLPPGVQPVICSGPLTLEAHPADDPTLTYAWNNGATTRTIQADAFGTYSVTKTNTAGCSIDGEIIVADNRPEVDLGPDITVCEGTTVTLDAATVPAPAGTTYQWTANPPGGVVGTSPQQSVNTTTFFVPITYQVTVTTPGGPGIGCTAVDDKVVTVTQAPDFTALPVNPTACAMASPDGDINFTITGPAASLFDYTILGPTTFSGTNQPVGVVNIPNTLGVGVYGITVTDQVSGCATQSTVALTDNAFNVTLLQRINNCDPVNIRVTHTAPGAFTYTVFDAITGQSVATGPGSGSPFDIPQPINSGNYRVQLVSGGCTAVSANFPINANPPQVINGITPGQLCTNPITLTVNAPGATTFAWNSTPGANIVPPGNTAAITAIPGLGTHTYTVTASSAASCPNTEDIVIGIRAPVSPDFTETDACATTVTLTATPSSTDYIYIWHIDANPGVVGSQQFVVTLADNNPDVVLEMRDKFTGCSYNSPVETVEVLGDLTLSLALPPPLPCEGLPFTIQATSNIPGGTFVWDLNNVVIPNQTTALLTTQGGGTYTAEYSVAGCVEEATLKVIPAPADPGDLFEGAIICPEPANPDPTTRQAILDAGGGFDSYEWFKDGVATGETTQAITVDEAGVYSVNLINQYGCASSDQTVVEEECDPKIVAPTAFRPASNVEGGSGLANREFGILTYFIDDTGFQVFIFNRWGEMVFQSNDRLFRWNGGYNNMGPLLPAGTYSYVVRYKSSYRPDDGVKEKRGGVVLVR